MKRISAKALTITLSMVVMFGAALTATSNEAAAKKVKVKKVTVAAPSGKTVYVAKGKKVKLTPNVKVTPNKKANKKVTYKSANSKIASVSGKGIVKGVKVGKTKVTVTSKKNKKKKATIKVVVKKAAVKKVKINSGNFVLPVGGKKTLKAKVTPTKNVSKKVAWSSSNKKVATVSAKGLVKAKKEGTAKITAKAADGSGKKATVKVTVGAGIANVSVPHPSIVRVALTSKKALNDANFVVQNRHYTTSKNYVALEVESVRTTDQKVYDVILDDDVSDDSYLRVTIGALSVNKSKEIYVGKIADYGDETNEEIKYVRGKVSKNKYGDDCQDDYYYISNTNSVGTITYTSLTGLPSGLKAYFNKTKTSVRVRGCYQNVEKGTTAVLTGVDEMGHTFTKKYIYYVGSDTELVSYAKPARTELAYMIDDEKTPRDEQSGYRPGYNNIKDCGGVAGGSGDYNYEVTYNGGDIDKLYRDENDKLKSVAPGTYNFDVKVTDKENSALTTSYTVSYNFVAGVTLSGVVRDAGNLPAREISVYGSTKNDVYGRRHSLDVSTQADGTYVARVIPGNYYLSADGYDLSINNVISGNTTKDFKMPLYRVNFTTDIPNAKGYSCYDEPRVCDSYGNTFWIDSAQGRIDGDFGLYAYLKPGTYEFKPTDPESSASTVEAYSDVKKTEVDPLNPTYSTYYLYNRIGEGSYKVTGNSFTVSGNTTVALHATPFVQKYTDYVG